MRFVLTACSAIAVHMFTHPPISHWKSAAVPPNAWPQTRPLPAATDPSAEIFRWQVPTPERSEPGIELHPHYCDFGGAAKFGAPVIALMYFELRGCSEKKKAQKETGA